jgi:hypothetical protein
VITSAPALPVAARLAAPLRRLGRHDRLALAALVALPILLYAPLAIAGHPVLPGDDLYQNYPLRVLAGRVLASGHLPSWDPLIWSGTPLLAGWNAGALFPGTLLFALLPPVAAWTVNFAAVGAVAGTGTYALVRRLGCQPVPALLAALAFSYTGFMNGQIVHLGLTEGSALLPWMLLAVDGLARRADERATLGHLALLGAAFGLAVLAGDPRAVSSAAIAIGVLALAAALRGRGGARLLALVLAGTLLGVAVSAVQWLPGLGFVRASQRGATAYDFFAAGSVSLPHLLSLLLLPFLLGGNGNFGQPVYFGSYNLPELTVGVGFTALVAALALVPELLAPLAAWLRGVSRRTGNRPLGVWYALVAVGTVLTLGTASPAGHLLARLPFYGGERLQNRNAVLIDLGLCVLLGYFADDLWSRRAGAASRTLRSATSRLLGALPGAAALALVAYAFARPASLQRRLHAYVVSPGLFRALAGYLVASALLALVSLGLALGARRLSWRDRRVLLAAACLADVGLYLAFGSWATVPAATLGPTSLSRRIAAATGSDGRFAIYNPSFITPPAGQSALNAAGLTDINVIQGTSSVQGYGSLVEGTYQDVTSTHDFENLAVDRLSGESFNTLDLRLLLTLPPYLAHPIAPGAPVPLPGSSAAAPAGPWPASASHPASFLLPAPATVARLTVYLLPQLGGVPRTLHVVTSGPGYPAAPVVVPVRHREALVRLPAPETVETVSVAAPTGTAALVGAVTVVTRSPAQRLLLDGPLQGALVPPHWTYAGAVGPFSAFENHETAGLAWLQPLGDTTPRTDRRAPGTVRVLGGATAGATTMVVDAEAPAVLVRSVTYAPGWTARITRRSGGPVRVVAAHRFGLVQAVDVGRGRWLVTWRYAPRELLVGIVVSGIGLILLAACTLAARRRTRAVP